MYINNVRDTIRNLSDFEYEEFLSRLRQILNIRHNKYVKPSVLRQRVDEFASGGNPKIDYFECYLLTLDEIFKEGAINALQNPEIKSPIENPKDRTDLMIKVMHDFGLSSQITRDLDDERILIEIKTLLYNSLEHCKGENKEKFRQNLHAFNNFLKIKL
ncbi:hypothetical protein bcgnr5378_06630 [Bacillus cereus]|uniref:Uncharacterized protein n=1 Tax=Bacillus cereus TaxID=1396 RepID=A0A164L9N4_BACCE|nr:hypothetical protein [Bacillus cereus]KZD55576.1 hypothetical protein B4088_5321 [Bacillus cereus]